MQIPHPIFIVIKLTPNFPYWPQPWIFIERTYVTIFLRWKYEFGYFHSSLFLVGVDDMVVMNFIVNLLHRSSMLPTCYLVSKLLVLISFTHQKLIVYKQARAFVDLWWLATNWWLILRTMQEMIWRQVTKVTLFGIHFEYHFFEKIKQLDSPFIGIS